MAAAADIQIGFTPLHLAIENKHDALVASLLRLGADADTPNKVSPGLVIQMLLLLTLSHRAEPILPVNLQEITTVELN